jgi:Beta-lactamase superfamily domain
MSEPSPIQLSQVRPEAADEITFVGTVTTIISVAGFSILTGPNFLYRGDRAYVGMGLSTKRVTEPALSVQQLPELDFIVLSHHHGDYFDRIAARDLDHDLPVITEPHAARKPAQAGIPVVHRAGDLAIAGLHAPGRRSAGDVGARQTRAQATRVYRAARYGQCARLLPDRENGCCACTSPATPSCTTASMSSLSGSRASTYASFT